MVKYLTYFSTCFIENKIVSCKTWDPIEQLTYGGRLHKYFFYRKQNCKPWIWDPIE